MNVLIDNDRLIQLSWRLQSEKAGVPLLVYSNISDFLQNAAQIDKKASIYVDSDLDHGKKGEIESKAISECGFKNIWLSTGYINLDLSPYPWIKAVVSKKPPF